jgi:NTE family protein
MKLPTMNRRNALGGMVAGSLLTMATASQAQSSARVTTAKSAAPRLGLALGGGSARGFAHIGVLKALEEAGYKPNFITGTSAGALVGAFYGAGYTPWQMEEIALKVREVDVADASSNNNRGMFSGDSLQRLVNEYVRNTPIERLKIPFGCVSTNLVTGESVLLRSGDTGLAVRASCSIPGVFMPTVINGAVYVDGGIASPLPVRHLRNMGVDAVIAVDVGAKPQNKVGNGLYEIILQSFEIMGRTISQHEAAQADFVIRPDTTRFSSSDFTSRKDFIQAGYEATRKALPALMQKIPPKKA